VVSIDAARIGNTDRDEAATAIECINPRNYSEMALS
jgi:hypothetical protein